MQELFSPHLGLMVWTVITFLLLVAILGKFGWGPLISAIEDRQARLREERDAAERARKQAQDLQADLERRLAEIDAKAKETLARAEKEVEALRVRGEQQARQEAQRIMDKTRSDLEVERRALVSRLRSDVASLAVSAAEKLLHRAVDEQTRKGAMEQFFRELDQARAK